MSQTMEFEGRTEDEAVQRACAALGVSADALDYTVVDEGSGGVFGLGARPVSIRVRPPAAQAAVHAASPTAAEVSPGDEGEEESRGGLVGPAPEKAAKAREVTQAMAERMGLAVNVTVRDEHEQIVVVIEDAGETGMVGDVFGKSRPPAIPSFQFLLNKIVNRFPHDRKHIVVEVPSAPKRERRPGEQRRAERAERPAALTQQPSAPAAELDPDLDPTLVAVARLLADRAKQLGKVITVHPMVAGDRRAVHQTVMSVRGVHTVSEGEGLYRRMHVVPDSLKGGGGDNKRRRRRRRRRGGGGGGERGEAPRSEGGAPSEAST
jgi:spoIIIJ-associated protein